jgi:hypothetical protein
MLHKPNASDLVEQVRADPKVREAFEIYRAFRGAFGVQRVRQEDGSMLTWGISHPEVKSTMEREEFDRLIAELEKVYRDSTGKSPLTWIGGNGWRVFYDFVIELFASEGLPWPAGNKIKRAMNRNRR